MTNDHIEFNRCRSYTVAAWMMMSRCLRRHRIMMMRYVACRSANRAEDKDRSRMLRAFCVVFDPQRNNIIS